MKIQYTRDDEEPHSCINQNRNIDNDLYCCSNEFPNHLAPLTFDKLKVNDGETEIVIIVTRQQPAKIDFNCLRIGDTSINSVDR